MKKRRFTMIVLLAILTAPPVGAMALLVYSTARIFLAEGIEGLYSTISLGLTVLVFAYFSYFYGLIAAIFVGCYGAWIIAKRNTLFLWKAYLIGFCIILLNAYIMSSLFPGFDIKKVDILIVSFTVTFFLEYQIVKNLLPWAGTSIIRTVKGINV